MIITHLLDISLADGEIIKIEHMNENVKITYKTWNDQILLIQFTDYIRMIDNRSIGNDIEHLKTDNNEDFRTEFTDSINDDLVTEEEIKDSKKYSFISSWGTNSLLTIYAKEIQVSKKQ
ncbi:MAG: hypothetical protein NAG76_18670 [Candidatus Pristimantibacillus lignocellulolyticus]|uniref:Uncharacterized protein n=1 Tax=Candidatus Pristimantibacillus lignocellulolyticus TaxID=2994561 RepID=A0A9J6ZD41_9BACL|nr:MAG: hypothetical protein NAG76_18670 [Candidatus Pristimantibacillus lignocellulolyticus]